MRTNKRDGITLAWGGYDYTIEPSRIATPRDALEWLHHLNEKSWMTPERANLFIEAACRLNGWTLHAGA